jgi:predicted Rossmann-fold nucleotide-binding protein
VRASALRDPAPRERARSYVSAASTLGEAVEALDLPKGRPVLLVVGSAETFDPDKANRLEQMFRLAVAPVCEEEGAVVLYGGTDSGIMSILGEALAECAPCTPLVGVVPGGLVATEEDDVLCGQVRVEPHRTHLLLTEGSIWGEEGRALVGAAERISDVDRRMVLAVGGGPGTAKEIVLATQLGWPVLLVTELTDMNDTVSDLIAIDHLGSRRRYRDLEVKAETDQEVRRRSCAARAKRQEFRDQLAPHCADLAEIAEHKRLKARALTDVAGIRRDLRWRLSDAGLLREAWLRYGMIDEAASKEKPVPRLLKLIVLVLGVLTVLFSILAGLYEGNWALRVLLLSFSLLSVAVVGWMVRRQRDRRWLELRRAAQAIGREIFRYRTWAGVYWSALGLGGDDQDAAPPTGTGLTEKRKRLAVSLAAIENGLSAGSTIGVRPVGYHEWPPVFSEAIDVNDSLLDDLGGAAYDDLRVEDQLRYFSRASRRMNRFLSWAILVVFLLAAAVSAFTALSFGLEWPAPWVALVASVAAAISAWLDWGQHEARSAQVGAAAAGLRVARHHWLALDLRDREAPRAVSDFAAEVEKVLQAESDDWERVLQQAHRSFRDRP